MNVRLQFCRTLDCCFTFFNSTAWRPPTPLPCSENHSDCRSCHRWSQMNKFNVSPRGAILLPSSPLELTPAGRTSPSAAGRTSPSPRSRASLLLQEARLSVLLLLLPLQTHDCEASLQNWQVFTCCSWLLCWCRTQTTCPTSGLVYYDLEFQNHATALCTSCIITCTRS